MKINVIECLCGTTPTHRKLKVEYANGEVLASPSFFSIESGRAILDEALANGEVTQTSEENAATLQKLEACGLPPTNVEAMVAEILGLNEPDTSGPIN